MTSHRIGTLLIAWLFFSMASGGYAIEKPAHGVILLYHHVAEDTPAITSIQPRQFAEQMQYLADNQFTIWPLPKLIKYIDSQQDIPDKVISITFDDNYQSVYSTAFPILKKYQWPFTIFVSTDAVDQNINLQASWEQLNEMAAAGATIANHTASHAHLLQRLTGESTTQWQTRIRQDIEKAQRRIREETGQDHKLLAYPYGEVDEELAQLVKHWGYIGIGQHSGPVSGDYPGYSLPRFPFAGRYSELSDFALKTLTLPLPIEALSADNTVLKDAPFSPLLVLQLGETEHPHHQLQCYGTGQGELNLEWKEQSTVEVRPHSELKPGRSRYNCTLPSSAVENGTRRFHWYSHPWIRPTDKGEFLE